MRVYRNILLEFAGILLTFHRMCNNLINLLKFQFSIRHYI